MPLMSIGTIKEPVSMPKMDLLIQELFGSEEIALGYRHDRPRFHDRIIDRISELIGLSDKLDSALDVGCGTGLSTVPLLKLARNVTGIDASAAMIACAERRRGIRYQCASAEELSPSESDFDIITVAGAMDWIDRDRFLPKALKALKPYGWLVIYDGGETGNAAEAPSFNSWFESIWLTAYPRPPRHIIKLDQAAFAHHELSLACYETYAFDLPFSLEKYVRFAMTQSMARAAIEANKIDKYELADWLITELRQVFADRTLSMQFSGYIHAFQRS